MVSSAFGLLVFACLLAAVATEQREGLEVAIVGGGIGGTAAAYFLRQELPSAAVTVIEAASRLGGRAHHFQEFEAGPALELGAGIVYTGNRYVSEFVTSLNLTAGEPLTDLLGNRFGLFRGSGAGFVLREPAGLPSWAAGISLAVQMVWRFGFPFFKLRSIVQGTLTKFDRIYDLLEAGNESFADPLSLWEAVGLREEASSIFDEYMAQRLGDSTGARRLMAEYAQIMWCRPFGSTLTIAT